MFLSEDEIYASTVNLGTILMGFYFIFLSLPTITKYQILDG